MTEYDWQTTRTNAIRKLGETLGAQLEHDLIQAFKENPRHVTQIIEAVIAERDAGATFASPWAIIRHRAQQDTEPVIATDKTERERAIRLAEAWIRTAGLYLNDQAELLHELFGEQETTAPLETLQAIEEATRGNPGRPMYQQLLAAAIRKTKSEGPQPLPDSDPGRLHPYDTPALRARMVALWENERPRGQQAERDVITRAEGRKAIRALQQEAQRSKPTPPEKTSSAPSGASTQPPAKTPTATTPSTPQPTKTPSATPSVPSRDSVATTTQPSKSPAEPDSDPHWHQRPEPESDPTWHVRPEPEVTA
jgi:hypothetical protein